MRPDRTENMLSFFTSRCANYGPRVLCNLHAGLDDRGRGSTPPHGPHQAQTARDHNLGTEVSRCLVSSISDFSSRVSKLAARSHLNIGIVNLSANVFWRLFMPDPNTEKKAFVMKEKNIALFNSILAKAEVTIILDEVHLTVSNSLMAKQKKLQWLKENLPDINLTGITATITAPVGSDREKRLISYFSPGAELLLGTRWNHSRASSPGWRLRRRAPLHTSAPR